MDYKSIIEGIYQEILPFSEKGRQADYIPALAKVDPNQFGMCLMPAGRDVTNPVSLLDTPYFAESLDELAKHFDVLLIDAPPIGSVIDAAEIAACCDGSILVIGHKKTRLREVAECKRQMEQSGTPVLGCIINKVSFETLSAKKYYNKSYYSHYRSGYYRKEPGETAEK